MELELWRDKLRHLYKRYHYYYIPSLDDKLNETCIIKDFAKKSIELVFQRRFIKPSLLHLPHLPHLPRSPSSSVDQLFKEMDKKMIAIQMHWDTKPDSLPAIILAKLISDLEKNPNMSIDRLALRLEREGNYYFKNYINSI